MYPDPTDDTTRAELAALMRAVEHNYPEVLLELKPSVRQLRNARDQLGLSTQLGESVTELPLLSAGGPLVEGSLHQFARKLFCALFYKHARSILPASGGVAVKWFTNLQLEDAEILRTLAPILPGDQVLQRARTNLDDQFFYRWVVAETKDVAVFLAFFRQSFAILGYVCTTLDALMKLPDPIILRPYDWA